MDYLTNYYKNLSEQLQEKVNVLQKLLEKRETEEVIVHDSERDEGEYNPTIKATLAKGKGSKRGRFVDIEPGYAIPGVSKQNEIHHAHDLADGDADEHNVWKLGKKITVNKKSIIDQYNEEV